MIPTWTKMDPPPGVRNREIAKKCEIVIFKKELKFHGISTFPSFWKKPWKPVFTENQLPGLEMYGNRYRYKGILVPRTGPKGENAYFS